MSFIKNNNTDSPFEENIKDKSVVLGIAASEPLSLHVMCSIVGLCVNL